jgi:hypothetical protein
MRSRRSIGERCLAERTDNVDLGRLFRIEILDLVPRAGNKFEQMIELLGSGELARRSQLSPKALRIYNKIALLRPVLTEPSNGYRRYGENQLATARLIACCAVLT